MFVFVLLISVTAIIYEGEDFFNTYTTWHYCDDIVA